MTSVERIKEICKERGIPIMKLEQACGFANGYIRKLKRGTLPDDRLFAVAEFLGLSPEYLATGEETEGYYLNAETAQIAQEMFEDPDMRTLYALKEKIGPERFKAHIELMRKLYEKEHPDA